MDAKTCIEKLGYVGVLDFATVDKDGAPQVRNISAIHFEGTDIYFLTARGKSFARQLYADGRVQILGYTRYKETIRVSGKAVEVPEDAHRMQSMQVIPSHLLLDRITVCSVAIVLKTVRCRQLKDLVDKDGGVKL